MREKLENLVAFIREHRSNEMHFAALTKKLDELITEGTVSKAELTELKTKQASAYEESREDKSSDWPLFEQFVQEFETIVLKVAKQHQRH